MRLNWWNDFDLTKRQEMHKKVIEKRINKTRATNSNQKEQNEKKQVFAEY